MKRTQNTSDFLKECIADSLLRLLRTKPLESITIREITELANEAASPIIEILLPRKMSLNLSWTN